MISVIKPLNAKLTVIANNLQAVSRGLLRGDPTALKAVSDLCTSISHIKADFMSTLASVRASSEASAKTMAGLTNPTLLSGTVIFWVGEVIAAVQFLSNLMKVITGLLSLNTIIAALFEELTKLKQMLNLPILWLAKSLERVKQKISKNIEWAKRQALVPIQRAYLNIVKDQLHTVLGNLKNTPVPGVNGDYADLKKTVFIYYKNVTTNDTAIAAVQARLDDINKQIVDLDIEINVNIPNDKAFWAARWKAEEEKDRKDLINNFPKLGVDF